MWKIQFNYWFSININQLLKHLIYLSINRKYRNKFFWHVLNRLIELKCAITIGSIASSKFNCLNCICRSLSLTRHLSWAHSCGWLWTQLNSTRDVAWRGERRGDATRRVVISEWIWVTGAGPKNVFAVVVVVVKTARTKLPMCVCVCMHARPLSQTSSSLALSLSRSHCTQLYVPLQALQAQVHDLTPADSNTMLLCRCSAAATAAAAATCVRAFCTIVSHGVSLLLFAFLLLALYPLSLSVSASLSLD